MSHFFSIFLFAPFCLPPATIVSALFTFWCKLGRQAISNLHFLQFFLNFGFACLRYCNRLAPHPKGNLARNTKVDWGMRPAVHVRREMPKPIRNQSAGRMSKASTWPNDMESQTALWLRFHESAVAQTNVESTIVPRPTLPSILRPQSAAPASIVG